MAVTCRSNDSNPKIDNFKEGTSTEEVLKTAAELFAVAEKQEDWQEKALCAQTDPEIFFPERGHSTREAKQICQGCEVRAKCLEYALTHGERWGVWGGLSESERRKLKHRTT